MRENSQLGIFTLECFFCFAFSLVIPIFFLVHMLRVTIKG